MVNPDGVIHGNNVANLTGVDINRRWKVGEKYCSPSVFYIKNLIK